MSALGRSPPVPPQTLSGEVHPSCTGDRGGVVPEPPPPGRYEVPPTPVTGRVVSSPVCYPSTFPTPHRCEGSGVSEVFS